MRTELFGTGGATVSGLFSAGPAGQRRISPPSPPNTPFFSRKPENLGGGSTPAARSSDQSLREAVKRRGAAGRDEHKAEAGGHRSGWGGGRVVLRSPVLGCVAESLAPALTTLEMSNFMTKMKG